MKKCWKEDEDIGKCWENDTNELQKCKRKDELHSKRKKEYINAKYKHNITEENLDL